MNYDHIPQEPEKRRVILVLSRLGLQQLKQSSSSDLAARDSFLSDQICLLDLSSIKDNSLSENLEVAGYLIQVLFLSKALMIRLHTQIFLKRHTLSQRQNVCFSQLFVVYWLHGKYL
jgi:hypothetical protein